MEAFWDFPADSISSHVSFHPAGPDTPSPPVSSPHHSPLPDIWDGRRWSSQGVFSPILFKGKERVSIIGKGVRMVQALRERRFLRATVASASMPTGRTPRSRVRHSIRADHNPAETSNVSRAKRADGHSVAMRSNSVAVGGRDSRGSGKGTQEVEPWNQPEDSSHWIVETPRPFKKKNRISAQASMKSQSGKSNWARPFSTSQSHSASGSSIG